MLLLAYSIFLANFLFGVLVKVGVTGGRRLRRVHQALYAMVIVSLIAAVIVTALGGEPARAWLSIGMMMALLGMPFFRGWSRGHWMYALFCSALYSALVFWH